MNIRRLPLFMGAERVRLTPPADRIDSTAFGPLNKLLSLPAMFNS